jgi:hypothetical protein
MISMKNDKRTNTARDGRLVVRDARVTAVSKTHRDRHWSARCQYCNTDVIQAARTEQLRRNCDIRSVTNTEQQGRYTALSLAYARKVSES